jgi:MurNAc alpha-1-phosphate uridylyltransferase
LSDIFGMYAKPAEGDNVLETGGGIFKALPILGDAPFLVVNADIYTDMPVPDVTLADEHLGHLVMVPAPDYRDCGDFDLHEGFVRNGERPAYTFSGVAIYRPELFHGCEAGRFPLAPILRDAADRGQLTGSLYEGLWADVGTPDRLAAVASRNQGGA